MMTKEQIEKIASDCGIEVTYTKAGKGGFIIDSSKVVYTSVNNIFMNFWNPSGNSPKRYSVNDETALFAA